MKTLLTLALLLLPLRAFALCDGWRTVDTVLAGTATALLAVDWAQTRNFLARPDNSYEHDNLLMGRHPPQADVNAYFISAAALTWGAACYLKPPWREVLLGGVIGLQVSVTAKNYRVFGTWGF